MKCWICGDEGTTGEHLTKASDLKSHFRKVTQQSPIYLHTDHKRNTKINSIKKSRELKSQSLICPNCNNARTAPHDRAWESLSTYLREKKPPIKKGDIIRLEKVFPGAVNKSMLKVHLYFVKLFGCIILEHKIPIEISPFRDAIMQEKPHEKIFLAFWSGKGLGTGHSNLDTANIAGKCVYASWFYIIDSVAVNVMYAEPNEYRKGLVNSWNPRSITKRLRIVGI
jgi:hypothetical protein